MHKLLKQLHLLTLRLHRLDKVDKDHNQGHNQGHNQLPLLSVLLALLLDLPMLVGLELS